jgi:hypothetical protein
MHIYWEAGIAIRAGRTGVRSSSPIREKFSPLHVVQEGSGAQSPSNPMHLGVLFPGFKQSGRETNYSVPTSAEVKNSSTPPIRHGVALN